jgi:hypothetical protein
MNVCHVVSLPDLGANDLTCGVLPGVAQFKQNGHREHRVRLLSFRHNLQHKNNYYISDTANVLETGTEDFKWNQVQ